MILLRRLLFAAPLLLAPFVHAQTPEALRRQIVASLPQWLKDDHVPSASIAYIADGKLAWTVVVGEQGPGVPATDKTLYNVASLTKPVTAETVLRMASKGLIDLDEPISRYWVDPDVEGNPYADLLTPRICLSHQTGFANWRRMTNGKLTFKFQPGSDHGYSGEGYFYVARFAEKKSQMLFDQLAQKYVLDPLAMHDTSYTRQPWFEGRLAQPYNNDAFLPPNVTDKWSAADLLRTTPTDYARFVIAVMHNEGLSPAIAAQRLVVTRSWIKPEDTVEPCKHEAAGVACHLTAGMGLGWLVINHNGKLIVDHSGSDIGDHSLAFFMPQSGTGAVIFTNGENGPKIMGKVAAILSGDSVYGSISQ